MKFTKFSLFFFSLIFVNSNHSNEQSQYSQNFQQQASIYPDLSLPSAPFYPNQPPAPYSHNQFSPPPGSYPVAHYFSDYQAQDYQPPHNTSQPCYRTTGSLPIVGSLPNSMQQPPARSTLHCRDRSKSLSDTEILSAQLEAARLELQAAHSTIASFNHKTSRTYLSKDAITQTINDNTRANTPTTQLDILKSKAQELVTTLGNLSTICKEHKIEYAAIVEAQAQTPISSPAPSGLFSSLAIVRKRSASVVAAKQESLDVQTHKEGAKQQKKIDKDLITIGWKMDEAANDLSKTEQEIKTMHHATLAAIRKKTGTDLAQLKDSSSS